MIPKSKEQVHEYTLLPRATPSAWESTRQSLALEFPWRDVFFFLLDERSPMETVTSLFLKPGKDQGPKSCSQKVLIFWGISCPADLDLAACCGTLAWVRSMVRGLRSCKLLSTANTVAVKYLQNICIYIYADTYILIYINIYITIYINSLGSCAKWLNLGLHLKCSVKSQSPFTLPCLSYFFFPSVAPRISSPSSVSRSPQQVADSGGHDDDLALIFAHSPAFRPQRAYWE